MSLINLDLKCQKVPPARSSSFLRWCRTLFFIIGILTLGYVGLTLLDANRFQDEQRHRFEDALNRLSPATGNGEHFHPSPLPLGDAERAKSLGAAPSEGALLGRIEISEIGLAAMMMEGIAEGTLRRAVGHIPGTPLPGEQGNVALAGHRDTFFRGLRNIRVNDEIILTTLSGSYRYRVDSTKVVDPEDTEVLDNDDDDMLTLVTCYPFNFVGSAPRRFIVRAHRVLESTTRH
jgi:sortase A